MSKSKNYILLYKFKMKWKTVLLTAGMALSEVILINKVNFPCFTKYGGVSRNRWKTVNTNEKKTQTFNLSFTYLHNILYNNKQKT